MNPTYTAALTRHLATFAGGYLAARGIAGQEEMEQIIGAIITIGGVIWSLWHKAAAARDARNTGTAEKQPANPAAS